MERVTPRLLAGWLAGAIAMAFGVVGCGSLTHQAPSAAPKLPSRPGAHIVFSGRLDSCMLSNGQRGLKFNDLCLTAPPAGWPGPMAKLPPVLQPVSMLALPDARQCQPGEPVRNDVVAA